MTWLSALFAKPKREKELDEEVRSHLEMAARERVGRAIRPRKRSARRGGNSEMSRP